MRRCSLARSLRLPRQMLSTVAAVAAAPQLLLPLLQRCSNLKTLQQAHCLLFTTGLHHDNLMVGRFIDACASLGFLDYAFSTFTHQTNPKTYLFNTMIRAYGSTGQAAKAVLVYRHIRALCLRPDMYSIDLLLKVVVRLRDVWLGRQIHCQSMVAGWDSDDHVINGLIRMYCCCVCLVDARKVFDETSMSNVAVWNMMVTCYAKAGEVDEARVLLERMPSSARNVVSWTSVISGYTQVDRPGEAIAVFRRMVVENVEPDEVAILAALSACAHLGALELGEWIHSYAEKRGLNTKVALNNALIDMYAKSGKISKAFEVFEKMKRRNVVTWTTGIMGLAMHGHGREALYMFERMEKAGVRPNDVTFIAILSACSHVGEVELGQWYFSTMRSKYRIEPRIEHYGCMIDLLGRAGFLQKAQEMVKSMPFEANAAIWGSLLAASKIHGDLELGERALQHLVKLEPQNSGNYSLLSNIYSTFGRWSESRTVRKMMKDMGVKKIAGGSLIEVRNRVHKFSAGDTSHPQINKINELVQEMEWQIKSDEFRQNEYDSALEFR